MSTTTETLTARRLAATDTSVAPLAVGAMLMGTRTPEDEARRILDHFVGDVVPRFSAPDGSDVRGMIDTADCYCWWEAEGDLGGHSEALLGRWLSDPAARGRTFLATKGSATLSSLDGVFSPGGPDWDLARTRFVGAGAATLRASLEASLDRLGTGSVDLYYVHVDDRSTPLEETVGFLAGAIDAGLIGAYGWSNVAAWRVAEVRAVADRHGWPRPVAVQEQHSYLRRNAAHAAALTPQPHIATGDHLDLLAACPDMQLVAYSTVLKGLYSARERRAPGFWAASAYEGPDSDARLAAVDRVAAEAGATGNQVVLAWLMAQDAPSVLPIIGARTWEQYVECVEAVDLRLTADQLAALDAAGA